MFAFVLSVTVLIFLIMILVEAMKPARSRFSLFELNQRVESGDTSAKQILEREESVGKILILKRVSVSLLLVLATVLLIVDFGTISGLLISLLVVIVFNRVAGLKFVRKLSGKLYSRLEHKAIRFVRNKTYLFGESGSGPRSLKISSRAELQHLLESSDYLSSKEKKMVINSLSFESRQISEVMTPRDDIVFVKRTEYLGPLALDELHKTGHSKLPVVYDDLNYVVGILHLERLLSLDEKRSLTAEKAMEAQISFANENQSLRHGLEAFLDDHDLLIVVNDAKETVGLLTLADVIGALFE